MVEQGQGETRWGRGGCGWAGAESSAMHPSCLGAFACGTELSAMHPSCLCGFAIGWGTLFRVAPDAQECSTARHDAGVIAHGSRGGSTSGNMLLQSANMSTRQI